MKACIIEGTLVTPPVPSTGIKCLPRYFYEFIELPQTDRPQELEIWYPSMYDLKPLYLRV